MKHSEDSIELKVIALLAVLAHVKGVLHWVWLVVLYFFTLLPQLPVRVSADIHILHHEASPLSHISLLLFLFTFTCCFFVNSLFRSTCYLGLV